MASFAGEKAANMVTRYEARWGRWGEYKHYKGGTELTSNYIIPVRKIVNIWFSFLLVAGRAALLIPKTKRLYLALT
jgi:hypothetical protein